MLHVHRSDRADGLISALRDLLADPPADPFAPEVVAVPTRGMERWLTQRLSNDLGICANVEFPFPRRLTGDAVAAASGIDADTDPWLPERLVWPLLEIVESARDEPWLSPHLGARRFTAVRHLASLFDRYALHRPELVRSWAAGEDEQWQAQLWRRLQRAARRARSGGAAQSACARLCAEPELADLPPRLSLFGLTRLPAGRLRVLRALATARDVHLFLLHPSPALWGIAAGQVEVVKRRSDPTTLTARNRLLASWGRTARTAARPRPGRTTHEHPVEHPTGTLLAAAAGRGAPDRAPRTARSTAASSPRVPWARAPGRGRPRRDPAPAGRGPELSRAT